MEVVCVKEEKEEEEQYIEISAHSVSKLDYTKFKEQMSHEETSLLVELIQAHQVIISKDTNAATNRLRETAWAQLTTTFNLLCKQEQSTNSLKLKWDTLKKLGRERFQAIQADIIKHKAKSNRFSATDDLLLKVASMVEPACTLGAWIEIQMADVDSDITEQAERNPFEIPVTEIQVASIPASQSSDSNSAFEDASALPSPRPDLSDSMLANNIRHKKKRRMEDDGRRELNLAMAAYYRAKTRKLNLECKIIKKNNMIQ